MSSADMMSPNQLRRLAARFVSLDPRYPAVSEEQNPVRNLLDAGIVGDDQRRGAELTIDA